MRMAAFVPALILTAALAAPACAQTRTNPGSTEPPNAAANPQTGQQGATATDGKTGTLAYQRSGEANDRRIPAARGQQQ